MGKLQVLNPDVLKEVKKNDGYCPCKLTRTPADKCMCAEFREKIAIPNYEGICHCGLYYYGDDDAAELYEELKEYKEEQESEGCDEHGSYSSKDILKAIDFLYVPQSPFYPSGAKYDDVNKPEHYNQGGVECIDAIKAATNGLTGIEAVCTANAIKYLWRWKLKNGAQDIEKAIWYANRLLKEIKNEANG